MKCPLYFRVIADRKDNIGFVEHDCLKEECVWWDKELGRCDPTGLIRPFIRLVQALEEINEKVPHEAQFRK